MYTWSPLLFWWHWSLLASAAIVIYVSWVSKSCEIHEIDLVIRSQSFLPIA